MESWSYYGLLPVQVLLLENVWWRAVLVMRSYGCTQLVWFLGFYFAAACSSNSCWGRLSSSLLVPAFSLADKAVWEGWETNQKLLVSSVWQGFRLQVVDWRPSAGIPFLTKWCFFLALLAREVSVHHSPSEKPIWTTLWYFSSFSPNWRLSHAWCMSQCIAGCIQLDQMFLDYEKSPSFHSLVGGRYGPPHLPLLRFLCPAVFTFSRLSPPGTKIHII